LDIFSEEQFNEEHHFAEVINDDQEEMHEIRLLRLLEEYENEKTSIYSAITEGNHSYPKDPHI